MQGWIPDIGNEAKKALLCESGPENLCTNIFWSPLNASPLGSAECLCTPSLATGQRQAAEELLDLYIASSSVHPSLPWG